MLHRQYDYLGTVYAAVETDWSQRWPPFELIRNYCCGGNNSGGMAAADVLLERLQEAVFVQTCTTRTTTSNESAGPPRKAVFLRFHDG
jgi:hypothetical protein